MITGERLRILAGLVDQWRARSGANPMATVDCLVAEQALAEALIELHRLRDENANLADYAEAYHELERIRSTAHPDTGAEALLRRMWRERHGKLPGAWKALLSEWIAEHGEGD